VHLASWHGVEFYNDSKSTIPASTIAAVHQLHPKPIVLFLGGVSKGVDRRSLIQQLAGKVRFIICFGTEAQQLATWCHEANIPSSAHSTLDEAFTHCVSLMHQGDVILFSPAGASFDLFANYAERGNTFKILIEELFANKLKFC
jgi:UDP-N-acetylmuramoylalanine--D-glutamate ligase